MSTFTRWSPIVLVSCAAAGALGCESPRVQATSVAPVPVPEVVTMTVRPTRSATVMELPGVVTAVRSVTLRASAAGEVQSVAEEGSRLAAGGVAAVLEATGLPAAVVTARAGLEAADRQRASARTAVSQAVRQAAATITALEQTVKVAQAERDRRRAALEEAQGHADTEPARLHAQLLAAEARLRRLRSGERAQRIRQLEAELEYLRTERNVAESQLQRKEGLLAKGYIARSEVDLARLSVERARANEASHREELSLQREGAHPEEIREGEQQVEAARLAWRGSGGLAQQVAQRRAELAAAEAEVVKQERELQSARAGRLTVERARQEAEVSDAEVRRRQAEFAEARERLARATVRAPFGGQVTRRYTRPGEVVAPGAALVDVVDAGRLRFEATASEAQVSHLHRGDRVLVTIPAASRGAQAGRIARVILASELSKQAYAVQVELESARGLHPGMSGTARITLGSRPDAAPPGFAVPLTCLRRHFPREQAAELLVLEGDRPVMRRVRLGAQVGEMVVVEEGLRAGERVIISEMRGALPEGPVRAREGTTDAAAP